MAEVSSTFRETFASGFFMRMPLTVLQPFPCPNNSSVSGVGTTQSNGNSPKLFMHSTKYPSASNRRPIEGVSCRSTKWIDGPECK